MEQTIGKTIIIEFNGIPGAGKTTLTNEIRQKLKTMKVTEIRPETIRGQKINYKKIILSEKIRKIYFIFIKALFLVSPITIERWKLMNMTFCYWYKADTMSGKKNLNRKVCILDQGIVQGFVSIAYGGKLRNERKYYEYIEKILSQLDNVICINCNIDVNTAKMRMKNRKPNGGRLYKIKNIENLAEILTYQKYQFEQIRKISIKRAISINMKDNVKYNAEKIIKHCIA